MEPDALTILEELHVEPSRVGAIETLSERHGHRVWRVRIDGEPRVLKWLPAEAATREIGGIELLRRYGVPTLPVYGRSRDALLLDDLAGSSTWRLAKAEDVESPQVSTAVADWYRALHAAGEEHLEGDRPAFLRRESDDLTPESMSKAGRSLGLSNAPGWNLAVEHIALLHAAEAKLSFTLNYQDFHWTNLAVSRGHPVAVVVFDYDRLGIGMRYSDCRNVESSLGQAARQAFRQRYGKYDEREVVIDLPLASLGGLVIASQRPSFPRWAEEIRCRVRNGQLQRDLERAVAMARSLME